MRKSTNAVASMRGYRYQEVLALELVLQSIANHGHKVYECTVSLEGDEDICNQIPGETQYIQVKNTEAKPVKVVDLQTDDQFWRTIQNWLRLYCRDGKTACSSRFIFHAVYKFSVKRGTVFRPLEGMDSSDLDKQIKERIQTSTNKSGDQKGYHDLIHSVKDKWGSLTSAEKTDFCTRISLRDCQKDETDLLGSVLSKIRFKTVNSATAAPELTNVVYGWWEDKKKNAKQEDLNMFIYAEASELAELMDQAAQFRSVGGLTFAEYDRMQANNQLTMPQDLDVSAYVEKINGHLPDDDRRSQLYRDHIDRQLSYAYMFDIEAMKYRASFKNDLEEHQKNVESEIEDKKALERVNSDDDSSVPSNLLYHFTFVSKDPSPMYGSQENTLYDYIRGSAHKIVGIGNVGWEV